MNFILQNQSNQKVGRLATRIGRVVNRFPSEPVQSKVGLNPQDLQYAQPLFDQSNAYDEPAVETYFPYDSTDPPNLPNNKRHRPIDLSASTCSWSTPNYVQYTRQASIPHICWTIVDRLIEPNAPIVIPLGACLTMQSSIEAANAGIRSFASIPSTSFTILTSFDALRTPVADTLHRTTVSMWCSNGRKQLNVDDYLKSIDIFRPEVVTSLIDTSLPQTMSNKQTTKYVDKAITYLTHLIEHRASNLSNNIVKSNRSCWASIPWPNKSFSLDQMTKALDEIMTFDAELDGYCWMHPITNRLLSESEKQSCKGVFDRLPLNKPRIVFGCLSPDQIVELIRLGADLFDNSFCTESTDQHRAILIRPKSDDSLFEWDLLSLEDKDRFERDHSQLDEDCDCYTCRHRFSRSYICHLATAHEMLAKVLLQFHNIRSYDRLFHAVRQPTQ